MLKAIYITNEFNEMDKLDTDLQRSISNYATASKTLASDTLNYLESEKNLSGLLYIVKSGG